MKKVLPYYITAIFGIAMYILVLIEIPLYFVYTPTANGTPPAQIILLRILVDMFVCIGLIGFFSGLKSILAQIALDFEWLATFIFASGLGFAILGFVADSIQAGGLWVSDPNSVNPTFVGQGADGALLIYGPINRLISTVILIASSTLFLRAGLFPKWIAWIGYAFAVHNLAFVPTLFFMTTPLDFYSVNGWNIPIAAGLFFLWFFIISILLIRKGKREMAETLAAGGAIR